MNPVDGIGFIRSDDVQGIINNAASEKEIEKKTDKVIIIDYTGDNLKEGDRKIEGLKADKYYMVEKEEDEDGNSMPGYPVYVTDYPGLGPGGLWDELGLITRISGGEINNLNNFYTYTVRAAKPFPLANLEFTDDRGSFTKTVTNGVIDVGGIYIKGSNKSSLNLSNFLSGKNYKAIAVSISRPNYRPWGWTSRSSANSATWNKVTTLELEGPDSTVDYIFSETGNPENFWVLKVIAGQKLEDTAIKITVTFSGTEHANITGAPANISISSIIGGASVTLVLAAPPAGTSWDTMSWMIGGNEYSTNANLVIDSSSQVMGELLIGDNLEITVLAVDNLGILYSATVKITVAS